MAGGIAGWLLGALYGGNYAVNLEFAGLRGYKATGQIGCIIGFLLLALFCGYVTRRILLRH